MKKNAFYAQSGGVTSVINATAAAVIQEAKKFPNQINKVYAGQNGILGALRENLIDTSKSQKNLLNHYITGQVVYLDHADTNLKA